MTPEQMDQRAERLVAVAERLLDTTAATVPVLEAYASLHNAAGRWSHAAVVARHTRQVQDAPLPVRPEVGRVVPPPRAKR